MTSLIRSSNKSIHDALRVLARDIQSEDGAANAAIAEAADRIAELGTENEQLHLENTKLKREIEDVKLVRYSIEDALTRSQHEVNSAQAELEREIAELRAHAERVGEANDRLVVENAALRADSARLDWLTNSLGWIVVGNVNEADPSQHAKEGNTLADAWRAAIDAARKEAQQ